MVLVIANPYDTSTQRLGFDAFTHEVEDVLKDHKQQQKVRIRSLYTPFLTSNIAGS
jgi:hypothetical protein